MFLPFSFFFSPVRLFLAVLAALWCLSSPAFAAEGQKSLTTRGDTPWTLNADKLVSLDDGVIVEASGGVLLQRGEDYMKADFARYYTTTNWIFVQGNVEARMGRDMLNAAEAEFDLTSRTGWLKEGSIFIAGPHMYVTGEKVDKLFGDRYRFKNARVTACDGDVPAWSLDTSLAEIEIDGYAKLSHTTLNILDMPVMEAPFLVLPAKTTRQSGLLMPDFGYSSLNGAFASVPYFQVIDESRDMTFYSTYMSRAGFMPGLEYRSHTRDQDKTWLALDLLYDRHTFSTEAGDRINDTDGKINTNEERFWLRGMGDGFVGDSLPDFAPCSGYLSLNIFHSTPRHFSASFFFLPTISSSSSLHSGLFLTLLSLSRLPHTRSASRRCDDRNQLNGRRKRRKRRRSHRQTQKEVEKLGHVATRRVTDLIPAVGVALE